MAEESESNVYCNVGRIEDDEYETVSVRATCPPSVTDNSSQQEPEQVEIQPQIIKEAFAYHHGNQKTSTGKRPIIVLSVLLALVVAMAVCGLVFGILELQKLRKQVDSLQTMQASTQTGLAKLSDERVTQLQLNSSMDTLSALVQAGMETLDSNISALDSRLSSHQDYSLQLEMTLKNHTSRFAGINRTIMENQLYTGHISDLYQSCSRCRSSAPCSIESLGTSSYNKLRSCLAGVFHSPNYPSDYDNNIDHSWIVTKPQSYYMWMIIDMTDFKIEARHDYLQVAGETIGYSNTNFLRRLISVANQDEIQMRFRTDGSVNYRGFKAYFMFV